MPCAIFRKNHSEYIPWALEGSRGTGLVVDNCDSVWVRRHAVSTAKGKVFDCTFYKPDYRSINGSKETQDSLSLFLGPAQQLAGETAHFSPCVGSPFLLGSRFFYALVLNVGFLYK